jgi:hypothetical protein
LRNFVQSGHIDAFRSIVGDGCGAKSFLGPPPGDAEQPLRAHPTLRFKIEAAFSAMSDNSEFC